jgi:hypothetical protein
MLRAQSEAEVCVCVCVCVCMFMIVCLCLCVCLIVCARAERALTEMNRVPRNVSLFSASHALVLVA